MRFSHCFIDRPIFATVLSILIVLIGGAYFTLPVAQYPEIAPPTIEVNATYPGASAEVVADTVATPIEQEINGVENMLYMASQATGDGQLSLTVTFALGTDLDTAQVLVQNRVAVAEPRLPEEVRRLGVTVRKNSPDMLMVIHLSSPDSRATSSTSPTTPRSRSRRARPPRRRRRRAHLRRPRLRDAHLARPGEGRLAQSDRRRGGRRAARQNVQVASGVVNQPPVPQQGAFQLNVETLGRLTEPRQFGNIVVKTDDGRARDAAARHRPRRARRAGLHGQRLSRRAPGGAAPDLPAARLQRARHRRSALATMEELSAELPAGLALRRRLQPDRVHRRVGRTR